MTRTDPDHHPDHPGRISTLRMTTEKTPLGRYPILRTNYATPHDANPGREPMSRLIRWIGCRLALVRYLRAELAIARADLAAARQLIHVQRDMILSHTEAPAVHRRPLHSFLNDPPPPAEFDPNATREYIVRDFTPSPIVAELVASVNVAMTNDT